MLNFPLKFNVATRAGPGSNTKWKAQAEDFPPIECSIPLEFMGPGGGYSPEDLFAISLLNCLIATFKVYCEKAKLSFEEIGGKVTLSVDRLTGQPGFAMTQADIFFDVKGASDPERVRKQLDAAIRDCAISNSIKTGKTFHINIS